MSFKNIGESMRLFLFLIIFNGIFSTNIIGQYEYWTDFHLDFFDGENVIDLLGDKNKRIKIYKYRDGNTSKVKVVNETCFDIFYNIRLSYSNESEGRANGIYTLQMKDYINKGQSVNYTKYVGNTNYIQIDGYDADGYSVSAARIAQPYDVWSKDIIVLNCLGYSSTEELESAGKRYQEEQLEIFERERQEQYERQQEIEEQNKRDWNARGLDYHIEYYNKKRTKGFHIGVPVDSLELFAKNERKYFLYIIQSPIPPNRVLKNFEPDEALNEFLTTKVTASLYNKAVPGTDFWQYVKDKNMEIQRTPITIIFDSNGNPIGLDYPIMDTLMNNLASYLKAMQKYIQEYETTKNDN